MRLPGLPRRSAGPTSATCSSPGRCSGPILASIHNFAYLQRLTRRIREAIRAGRFVQLRAEVLEALGP